MTTTAERETVAGPEGAGPSTSEPWLGRAGRLLVIACLVAFASWTLCYQVALAVDAPALATLAASTVLAIVLLAALATGGRRPGTAEPLTSALPRALPSLGALAATAAALALVLDERRAAALVLGGLVATASLVLIALRPSPGTPPTPAADATGTPVSRWLWPLGWVAAVVSAYGATRISRSDGDDAYFINVSTWVADRGRFAMNDTMISQDEFTPNLGHSPPTHSVEALIGALGRLTGVEAGSIAYLAVPPALTLVGILILTWAVQEARIPTAPAALVASVGYLWTTGGTGYSFGSFFAVRMWQGKAMLLSLAIPLLVILGSRLLRHGGWRNHLLFGAAVVASVGFSNSSAFITPLLLGAMFVAGLALRRPAGAFRVLLWALYPLACGALSYVLAPASATAAQLAAEGFPTEYDPPGNPLGTVPGHDGILIATTVAIGLGALGLGNRTIRAIAASTLAVAAVCLLPPVRGVFDAVGLGGVVWRMWWLVPVPLLLGGVVGAVTGRMPRLRLLVAVPLAIALALLPLLGGRWVGADTGKTRIVSPTSWKVPPGALATAQYANAISSPGDTVLLPHATSSALAGLTVEVQPVTARVLYQPSYSNQPETNAGARRDLQRFIDRTTPKDLRSLDDELALLDVRTACLRSTRDGGIKLLEGAGYSIVGTVRNLTCLQR